MTQESIIRILAGANKVARQSKEVIKTSSTNYIEQNIMREKCGSQDQIWAAHGGFNTIEFKGNNFNVKKFSIFTFLYKYTLVYSFDFTLKSVTNPFQSITLNLHRNVNNNNSMFISCPSFSHILNKCV